MATLSHCRCWADCITVTLARPPEEPVSLTEMASTRMGGQPQSFREDLRPIVPGQLDRRGSPRAFSLRPIALRCSGHPRTDSNTEVMVFSLPTVGTEDSQGGPT